MSEKKIEYPAVLYWEKHPTKDEEQVAVKFPDLIRMGLPATTVGSDEADAIEAARDILNMMIDEGVKLPQASRIDEVSIALRYDIEIVPNRIVITNIAI